MGGGAGGIPPAVFRGVDPLGIEGQCLSRSGRDRSPVSVALPGAVGGGVPAAEDVALVGDKGAVHALDAPQDPDLSRHVAGGVPAVVVVIAVDHDPGAQAAQPGRILPHDPDAVKVPAGEARGVNKLVRRQRQGRALIVDGIAGGAARVAGLTDGPCGRALQIEAVRCPVILGVACGSSYTVGILATADDPAQIVGCRGAGDLAGEVIAVLNRLEAVSDPGWGSVVACDAACHAVGIVRVHVAGMAAVDDSAPVRSDDASGRIGAGGHNTVEGAAFDFAVEAQHAGNPAGTAGARGHIRLAGLGPHDCAAYRQILHRAVHAAEQARVAHVAVHPQAGDDVAAAVEGPGEAVFAVTADRRPDRARQIQVGGQIDGGAVEGDAFVHPIPECLQLRRRGDVEIFLGDIVEFVILLEPEHRRIYEHLCPQPHGLVDLAHRPDVVEIPGLREAFFLPQR